MSSQHDIIVKWLYLWTCIDVLLTKLTSIKLANHYFSQPVLDNQYGHTVQNGQKKGLPK